MTVLCEVCGKAATLVMTDTVSAIDSAPVAVCLDCCYGAISKAAIGTFLVRVIKGVKS